MLFFDRLGIYGEHMSKTLSKQIVTTIVNFLAIVARRNGWKPFLSANGNDAYWDTVITSEDGGILFSLEGELNIGGQNIGSFSLELELLPHNTEQVYFVDAFRISTTLSDEKIAQDSHIESPNRVLAFFGKHLPNEGSYSRPLNGELWEVRRAADLEALFRAYDHVARLFDGVTLFNLPQ